MPDGQVFVTFDAMNDLDNIVEYIEIHDSSERADQIYKQIKKIVLGLKTIPRRGRIVPELKEIGIYEYREIFFKPYRILYFIIDKRVFVFAIFDGRRDLQEVLQRRLLQ
ncbi:MAG: type II toxin-antitoxin system RelE/ParE family toxin [Nitrospirae bacterium]|nr:type II toxin-antitoxin system RelE/ParE family toxin [Nitrospirota bacterium]MBI3352342.1 type II toxin-antitoxin system RelE/ParE family toxin [Nitrospirota bacterium]